MLYNQLLLQKRIWRGDEFQACQQEASHRLKFDEKAEIVLEVLEQQTHEMDAFVAESKGRSHQADPVVLTDSFERFKQRDAPLDSSQDWS